MTNETREAVVSNPRRFDLIDIGRDGFPVGVMLAIPDTALDILQQTKTLYAKKEYVKPWIAYFAVYKNEIIGYCTFKSYPSEGAVEIAYATMPRFEGMGVATQMASKLVELARNELPRVEIFAQTLPIHNASTRVLTKLGFEFEGTYTHPEDGEVWTWRLHSDQVQCVSDY